MPKQYKWFINSIFFEKKYICLLMMITVRISHSPKSVFFYLYIFIMYERSEVSHMRRFKSFAARLCGKDYEFMSWVT